MTQRSQTLKWLAPALAIYVLGFALATMFDMPIDVAVFNPANPFAIIMEAIGWYPAFIPAVMLLMLYVKPDNASRGMRLRSVLAGVLLVVACGVLFAQSYKYFTEREFLSGPADPWTWVWLGLGLALALFGLLKLLRLGDGMRRKITFFALWGSVYMAANTLAINVVKMIWRRTRFDDMVAMGSFDAFTPWYHPFGNGGSSFPSGHTGNAAGIFALIILCDIFPAFNRRRKLVYGLCWGYIAAMAFARILIGRHFLSDTLAASGIMAILLYALRRQKPYQQDLKQARLAGTEAEDGV